MKRMREPIENLERKRKFFSIESWLVPLWIKWNKYDFEENRKKQKKKQKIKIIKEKILWKKKL